mmetsp:Transcript_29218/g.62603  ORF Transcript_29218/g.62603 Transcript_29218/m.62603 type:complete len:244 (-) Transcript_29218:801-1532(-)
MCVKRSPGLIWPFFRSAANTKPSLLSRNFRTTKPTLSDEFANSMPRSMSSTKSTRRTDISRSSADTASFLTPFFVPFSRSWVSSTNFLIRSASSDSANSNWIVFGRLGSRKASNRSSSFWYRIPFTAIIVAPLNPSGSRFRPSQTVRAWLPLGKSTIFSWPLSSFSNRFIPRGRCSRHTSSISALSGSGLASTMSFFVATSRLSSSSFAVRRSTSQNGLRPWFSLLKIQPDFSVRIFMIVRTT